MKYIFFPEKGLEHIRRNKGAELIRIKHYLKHIISLPDTDILNPFCVACNIDRKADKDIWSVFAKEMKIYAIGILWLADGKKEYPEIADDLLKFFINFRHTSQKAKNTFSRKTYFETASVMRALAFALSISEENGIYEDDFLKTRKKLAYSCERLCNIIKNSDTINTYGGENFDIITAINICASLLKDYDDRAENWINLSFDYAEKYMSDKKFSGILDWELTLYSLCLIYNASENINRDAKSIFSYIEKNRYYALSATGPMCAQLSQFDQSVDINIHNPLNGILSKILAEKFKDPYIAWGIKNTPIKKYYHPLEFFYSDTDTECKSPKGFMGSSVSSGSEYAFLRSGWSEKDSLITLKSSGTQSEFSHKDQNNMEIFLGSRKMLIESGTCYTGHPNYEIRYLGTHAHNSILIDGKPQLPRINRNTGLTDFITTEKYDMITGDASSAYSKAKIYKRNILFLKPDILIVYDYISLYSIGSAEWLWHTPGSIHVHSLSKHKSILFSNKDRYMSFFVLKPKYWSYRITKDFVLEDWITMHESTHDVLRITGEKAVNFNFIALFHLNSKDHETLPGKYVNNTLNLEYCNSYYNIKFEKGKIIF